MTRIHIKLIYIFLFFLITNKVISQSMAPDSASGFSGKAYIEYIAAVQEDLELFNGKEHTDYLNRFDQGSPYFLEGNFSKGDVTYLHKTYKDISLIYDVVKDEIAVHNYSRIERLVPDKTRVDAFTVHGYHFIKLPDGISNYKNLPKGYYDLLYDGTVSLLGKHTKNIQTGYRNNTAEIRVYSKDLYYVKRDNTLYQVNSKKSFFKLLSDKKKEITQFMRQSNLNFKEGKEEAMIKIISYYNSLVK